MKKPIVTIHLIDNGYPMCRFFGGLLEHWPFGHISIPREEYEGHAKACRDPEHELHAVMQYEICVDCEEVLKNPSDLKDRLVH